MMNNALRLGKFVIAGFLLWGQGAAAEDPPLTENVPISEFQNRTEDAKAYDFDAPPQGMFRSIALAEDFEERLGFQRTHEIMPVKPTEQFPPHAPAIFIVFSLHQHYQGFKVFGRCMPERWPVPYQGRSSAKTPCTSPWRMTAAISNCPPRREAGNPADTKSKYMWASRSMRRA